MADVIAAGGRKEKGFQMGCAWVGYNITQLLYMYKPSGTPSFFLYSTFSFALRKSAYTGAWGGVRARAGAAATSGFTHSVVVCCAGVSTQHKARHVIAGMQSFCSLITPGDVT